MTQPDYVPLVTSDRVRPSDRLRNPGSWHQDRPAELKDLAPPSGPSFGKAGTDAGYGLKLAKRFLGDLVIDGSLEASDVVDGCFACGSRRAARFGRAPVVYDMEWAYTLWGFLAEPPEGLVEFRMPLFRGASHDYWHKMGLVDAIRVGTFSMSSDEVREHLDDWQSLFN